MQTRDLIGCQMSRLTVMITAYHLFKCVKSILNLLSEKSKLSCFLVILPADIRGKSIVWPENFDYLSISLTQIWSADWVFCLRLERVGAETRICLFFG